MSSCPGAGALERKTKISTKLGKHKDSSLTGWGKLPVAQWASPDGRPPRKAPGDLLLTMSGLGGEYFGTSGRCLDVAAGAELEREKKGQKK